MVKQVKPAEPCEKCGKNGAEDVPLHGYTQALCEGCARVEAPHLFSDVR